MIFTKKCKITVFGDSIPKGIIFKDNKLSKIADNAVKIVAEYYNIKIENCSVYGQTMTRINAKGIFDDYLKNLNKKIKNIAVISIGGNDSDYNWQEVEKSPKFNHLPKTPPKEFIDLLDKSILKLKKHKVKVILTNIPPIDSKRYFNNVISKIANPDKVLQFLDNDIENIYRHQEFYNLLITKCAQKNKCRLIDIRQSFLWDKGYLNKICDDGIHPNQQGYNLIAQSIIKQINNIK